MSSVLSKRSYSFGLFQVDTESGKLLRKGERVKLQDLPFRLLCILLEHAGEVVTREQLRQLLWSADTYVEFEGSLNAALKRLRYALGDSAENPTFIETLPKRGYRFIAPVTAEGPAVPFQASEPEPAQAKELPVSLPEPKYAVPESTPSHPGDRSSPSRRTVIATAGIVALALLVVISYHRLTSGRDQRTAVAPRQKEVTPRRSVAVLGFANTSGRPEDAWLSTALSEMLSTELASGDRLRLVPGEDVTQLRMVMPWTQTGSLGQETTSRIGASLNGDLLVLGSYASIGPPQHRQIRVDVRLQDAPSGNILSEVSATGREDDLFHLASGVGGRLREKLGVATVPQQAAELASSPTNAEAMQLYALGLEKLREFDALPARDFFEGAVKADPQYAPVHAALAEAWSMLGYDQKAVAEAKSAYELGTNLPRKDRLFIEARYRALNKEWDKATEVYRALFDFFPDDLEYGLRLADTQTRAGKADDAEATIQSLRQLPVPIKNDPRIDLAEEWNSRARGQWEPAKNAAAQAVEKARTKSLPFVLADALNREANDLANLGEHEKAIAAAQEARNIYSTAGDQFGVAAALAQIGRVQWLQGNIEASEKTYQQALAIHKEIGNKTGTATDMAFLASADAIHGDVAAAKTQFQDALAIYREVGDKNRSAHALTNIAWTVDAMGSPASALPYYTEALAIYQQISSQDGTGEVLDERCAVLARMGELSRASNDCRQALAIFRNFSRKHMLTRTLVDTGNVATLEDRLDDGRAAYSEALNTAKQIGDQGSALSVQLQFATLAQEQNQFAEARQLLTSALDYLHAHDDPAQELSAESRLAILGVKEGNLSDAESAIERGRKRLPAVQWFEERYEFSIADARLQAATGKLSEARRLLDAVIADSGKHDDVHYQLVARLALCEVEAKIDPATARAHAVTLEKQAGEKGFNLIARKARAIAA
jgi:eukaryotic-like serine/threonine-protein kinase